MKTQISSSLFLLLFIHGCGSSTETDSLISQSNSSQNSQNESTSSNDLTQSANLKFLNNVQSFSRGDNIVIDNISGLKWEDQPVIFYGNFNDAESYCENLTIDEISDWRLPNLKEFWYLHDRNQSSPAINIIFQNVENNIYWTSQTVSYIGSEINVWTIDSSDGYDDWSLKTDKHYVRCVSDQNILKDFSFEYINFSRDDQKSIVIDNTNGLMWQDSISSNLMSWSESGEYCNNLTFGGYYDWRLPKIEELFSITNQRLSSIPSINNIFQSVSSEAFWTSTVNNDFVLSDSWNVNFDGGGTDFHGQLNSLAVRCVRDN